MDFKTCWDLPKNVDFKVEKTYLHGDKYITTVICSKNDVKYDIYSPDAMIDNLKYDIKSENGSVFSILSSEK